MSGPVKTAILSVWNKSGLAEFARHLSQMGVTLYSTGGTFRALEEVEIRAIPIGELTQFPEMMDGRVKTLHPAVFAGILARRDHKKDLDTLIAHQMQPIDLVVVNPYPFQQRVTQAGATEAQIIESVDVGGIALLRAAAKNFKDVLPVVDPVDYASIVDELLANNQQISESTRRRLALKAFRYTSEYEAAIYRYFKETTPE